MEGDGENGVRKRRQLNLNKNSTTEAFLLSVTGRIESSKIFGVEDVYCKYNFAYGPDWQVVSGIEEAISQITECNEDGTFIWNFPVEISFKSTNPHGWPQLVLSVYGSDCLGNHIARGYGSTHIPLCQGSYTKTLSLFVPESSTFLQKISSWIVGRRPEFVDSKIVAQSDGRQIVRVQSNGEAIVKFEIVMKDFQKLGFVSSSTIFDETKT